MIRPRPAPTAGKPLTLGGHFFWAVVIVFACVLLVVVFAAIPPSDTPCAPQDCAVPTDTPADP